MPCGCRSQATRRELSMKKVLGGLMLLMATGLIGWLVYIFFIEVPKPGVKQETPLPAFGFIAALIFVGFKWIRGPVKTDRVYAQDGTELHTDKE